MMHPPVLVPERSRAAPSSISLRVGDRWIRVPAWWAAPYFRHGQTVRPDDVLAVRRTAAIAWVATRRLERIIHMKARPDHPMTDTERWQAMADVHAKRMAAVRAAERAERRRSIVHYRLIRALLLIGSAGASATLIVMAVRAVL